MYNKHLSEPWFSLIKLKHKTCEGRLNKGDFQKMQTGNIIKFTNNDFGFTRSCYVKILSVHKYDSFTTYLKNEKLNKCLPGIESIKN